jgi:predicted amidohydrolase YtcJ
LEKGKWADFIILDKDLMKASPAELLKINTLSTYINGVKVHAAAQ